MYAFTFDEVKSKLVSPFGKTLTEEQFNFIRTVNESLYLTDKYWTALNDLLGWDLELICREDNE